MTRALSMVVQPVENILGLKPSALQVQIVSTFLFVFIISKILAYRRGLKAVGYIPGVRFPFHPFTLPGALIPTTWWNPGFNFSWDWRNTVYRQYESDTISFVPLLLGNPAIHTCDLDVIRQVTAGGSGRTFYKPENATEEIAHWGMNLVASDGDMWRKHRRIMAPAFNGKLYKAVWAETRNIYRDMVVEEGWTAQARVSVPTVQALTFKVALLAITKCGFGFPFTWTAPARTADGSMALQEAFRVISDTIMTALFVPRWLLRLPIPKFREILEAEREVRTLVRAQIAERKAYIRSGGLSEKMDLFSMLVEANENEEVKFKLDDSELIGNAFIMLLAGHETTAHTLAATIGFLAIHDDLQEDIYQQIVSVVGEDRDPEYDDYAKLDKVLSAFLEAMRMFPAGYVLQRAALEDTVLRIPKSAGEEGTYPVPISKGTTVFIDVVGLQYNPRYFDAPDEFRPARWHGVSHESDAVTAFSIGPRACIGRKFATTEAVCFLTMLLREYSVHPILNNGETKAQWAARVLDGRLALTLGVKDVPVTFVRRGRD